MESKISFVRNVTVFGVVVAVVYTGGRAALRGRRVWRNVKIIKSVDTGSVWTTE